MWFAIASAIASLVSNTVSTYQTMKESKKQAKEVAQQAQAKADARAREAKTLMSKQKSSFLKGGVYFDSGSANAVIDETYDTYMKDLEAINLDSTISQNRLIRQGKTAFWNYLANPAGSSGSSSLQSIFANTGSNNQATDSSKSVNGTKMSGGQSNTRNIA